MITWNRPNYSVRPKVQVSVSATADPLLTYQEGVGIVKRGLNGGMFLPPPKVVDAVVDTGFDGALTLPIETAKELLLHCIGVDTLTLAGNSTIQAPIYLAVVSLQGIQREHVVHGLPGDPLLGMTILGEFKVTVDNGRTRIESPFTISLGGPGR